MLLDCTRTQLYSRPRSPLRRPARIGEGRLRNCDAGGPAGADLAGHPAGGREEALRAVMAPGLQMRIGAEFKFRTYLNCRTYTAP